MKKILCLSLALLIIMAAFAGCTQNTAVNLSPTNAPNATKAPDAADWAYIEAKKELIVGLDDTFAPMGFRDDKNELIGFDIDLANAVGEVIGVKIKFQPISWDAKEMELSSKRIDCIWNGMSITPERKESMSLTKAYLNNKMVVMGKDVSNIKTLDDLKGKKIGTQQKSAGLDALTGCAIYNDIKANITELPTYDEVILAIKAGRCEVMVVDEVLGSYKNSVLPDDQKMTVASFNFGDDLYGIGCRKGDTMLVEKIEKAIQTLIDNGKAEKISQKWFGENLVLPQK